MEKKQKAIAMQEISAVRSNDILSHVMLAPHVLVILSDERMLTLAAATASSSVVKCRHIHRFMELSPSHFAKIGEIDIAHKQVSIMPAARAAGQMLIG
jgi:hypothetical protein